MKRPLLMQILFICIGLNSFAQNVGIGTTTPAGRLHVKGNADSSQLVIDAHSTQLNTRPLIRLRNSAGKDLLWIHSDDTTNTFIGLNAGRVNNANGITRDGINNAFIGNGAGYSNSLGSYNTANGYRALYSNSTGSYNTANGTRALYSNTTGSLNTANGYQGLANNTTGNYNTANGHEALISNTTGNWNTANGVQTLFWNTTGSNNTASGNLALYLNGTGSYNTANGMYALNSNTTGSSNTANGYQALNKNSTGYYNTANGAAALSFNSTGYYNTASGNQALYYNSTGNYNTAMGFSALGNTTAANYNVAVGFSAGDSYNNGFNNVFVGANTDVTAAGLFNVIALGQGTVVGASSTARFGNSATTSYGGWAGWTNVSDGRYKKNVQENVPGLSFIMKLRPVTYNLMATQLNKDLRGNFGETEKQMQLALAEKENVIQTGFVAQEVEAVAKQLGFNFSGIDKPQHEDGQYGLRYAEFVVPLVKAVQELSIQNEDLKKQHAAQNVQISALLKRIEKIESFIISKK